MKKEFFLNLTRIIEANPKIYLSIIVGVAGCLVLFIAEAVHIQKIIELLIFDKKNEFGKVQFALLDGIGKIKINQEADNELIFKAFEDYAI